MIFQEPKVEFIKMQFDDVICASCPGNAGDQEVIGKCGGTLSLEDCVDGALYVY